MSDARAVAMAAHGHRVAVAIACDVRDLGLGMPSPVFVDDGSDQLTYDQVVDDDELRHTTRKLFLDGHYPQSVEAACKCVNNIVKHLADDVERDGAKLMRHAFSLNNPVLRLNRLRTRSERDQQQGYMDMFAGIMTGVRNPRAHEHAYLDDPVTALELLGFVNHLVRMVRTARPSRNA